MNGGVVTWRKPGHGSRMVYGVEAQKGMPRARVRVVTALADAWLTLWSARCRCVARADTRLSPRLWQAQTVGAKALAWESSVFDRVAFQLEVARLRMPFGRDWY